MSKTRRNIYLLCSFIFILVLTFGVFYRKNSTNLEKKYIDDYYPFKYMSKELKNKSDGYMNEYINLPPRSLSAMGPYSAYENFLYYKDYTSYFRNERIQLDDNGIPKVSYSGEYHYNAVTISQYGFSLYADYLENNDEELREKFLLVADFLCDLQNDDGSFRYDFEWENLNSKEKYPVGWVSSMAQGHALSVYARAYYLTNDIKYIESGNKAFDFLILPKEKGGTMTTLEDFDKRYKDRIFFEEYLSTPNSYTLNGYMFTLFGIYDWARIEQDYPELKISKNAAYYFDEGIESLCIVLPYYDIDGFSTYDLGHLIYNNDGNISPSYHSVHIMELSNLYSITGNKTLQAYQLLWTKYIDDFKNEK